MRDVVACLSIAFLAFGCSSDDPVGVGDGTETGRETTGTMGTTTMDPSSTTASSDPSSTTMATDVDTTMGVDTTVGVDTETDGETETDTDAIGPCRSDDECTDAIEAFCVEGACVACSATASPHDACAAADPAAPLCVEDSCISCADAASPDDACAEADPNLPACLEGQCTQCSETNDSLCEGATPACVAGECAPCTFHFQCPDSACHLWTGECLDVVPATIGPDESHEYATLTAALASVDAGEQAVFIMHDNADDAPYVESVLLDGGRVVAILAADGHRPVLQGDGHHAVRVDEATLMVEGLRFAGFYPSSNPLRPLDVRGGYLALDRTEVVDNARAIFLILGSAGIVRNTTVSVSLTGVPAIRLSASTLQMTYSTLTAAGTGASAGDAVPAGIVCSGDVDLQVRNSIITNVHANTQSLHDCGDEDVSVTHTATREPFPGAGNVVVGPLQTGWFVDWPGDLRLSTDGNDSGAATFADIAQWSLGQPPFDIDLNARPNVEGAADHAGAHRP